MVFKGLGVSLITPFTDSNEVNVEKLKELVKNKVDEGVDAIVLCSQSGEGQSLSDMERLTITKTAIEVINQSEGMNKLKVLTSIDLNDTRDGIQLAIKLSSLNLDGAVLSLPFYNIGNKVGIEMHIKLISKMLKCPVLLQNDEKLSGVVLDISLVEKLANDKVISGLIESTDDLNKIQELSNLLPEGFPLYTSNEKHLFTYLCHNAAGVLSSSSNIYSKGVRDIIESYENNDLKGSLKAQLNLNPFIDALNTEINPIPVKTAMNMMNEDVGSLRLPLFTLNPDGAVFVQKEMVRLGIIPEVIEGILDKDIEGSLDKE